MSTVSVAGEEENWCYDIWHHVARQAAGQASQQLVCPVRGAQCGRPGDSIGHQALVVCPSSGEHSVKG